MSLRAASVAAMDATDAVARNWINQAFAAAVRLTPGRGRELVVTPDG